MEDGRNFVDGHNSRPPNALPAYDTAFPDDVPNALWLRKPGDRLRPEIKELEKAADLPSRALGDDKRARSGQRLQPGSEVRGLADHTALLSCALADQVA